MKIFLSYASQDREPAHLIYLALRDQGHKVFFDRANLPAGEEFHNRIRAAIESSQLFLLLLSANAVDAGSYTLTELSIADKAKVKLLPVALGKLDVGQLPASLKAVTFLESDGNLPATVAAEVHRIATVLWRRRLKYVCAAAALIALIGGVVFYVTRGQSKSEIVGKDGALVVLIPSGVFITGDDEDLPRREIFVDAYYLDKYEVTVARYADFLKATGNIREPEEWHTVNIERDGELPVVGVDWQDASSYCQWAGVCPPRWNGKRRRVAATNVNFLGVMTHRPMSVRDFSRLIRTPSTKTESRRSALILKELVRLRFTIFREMFGSGWPTGLVKVFSALMFVIPKDPIAAAQVCCAAAVGTVHRSA